MLRGKTLLFPSARLQVFCPRGADVQHLALAWPLSLAHLLGMVCESQTWWAFNFFLNKAGRTVLSAELSFSCTCMQVELIPLLWSPPWDRGESWSVPWQCCGAYLLQCHEDVHMQGLDFSTCKQEF